MNNQFDELTKTMARSVTRRGALKQLGLGLAGMTLACFGLANKAEANKAWDFSCKGCVSICMAGTGLSKKDCQARCRQAGYCGN